MSLPQPSSDSTVLITGASSGIGADIARHLDRRGHGLSLTARRRDRLEELAAELRDASGVRVEVHPADLSDPQERAALVSAVRGEGRVVAGLVNNAGFGSSGRLHRLDLEQERRMVALNVEALHDLVCEILPDMVDRGAGAILNLGSIAGNQPVPTMATYGATKAFVNSLSEALHAELSGTGVSCSLLTPGPVDTEFQDVAGAHGFEAVPGFAKVSADEVARQGVEAMVGGRRSVVPGLATKAAALSGRLSPRGLVLGLQKQVYGRV
jgi:uncharacterized protein